MVMVEQKDEWVQKTSTKPNGKDFVFELIQVEEKDQTTPTVFASMFLQVTPKNKSVTR